MKVKLRRQAGRENEDAVVLAGGPSTIQVDEVKLNQVAPNLNAPSLAPAQMASKSLLDQAQKPLKQPGADAQTATGPAEQNNRPDELQQQAAGAETAISRVSKPGARAGSTKKSVQRRIAQ